MGATVVITPSPGKTSARSLITSRRTILLPHQRFPRRAHDGIWPLSDHLQGRADAKAEVNLAVLAFRPRSPKITPSNLRRPQLLLHFRPELAEMPDVPSIDDLSFRLESTLLEKSVMDFTADMPIAAKSPMAWKYSSASNAIKLSRDWISERKSIACSGRNR